MEYQKKKIVRQYILLKQVIMHVERVTLIVKLNLKLRC